MRKFICLIFALVLLIPAVCASEQIYFLNLRYDSGGLELLDVYLTNGYPIVSDDTSRTYRLELLSPEGGMLYQGYFNIPNRLYAPPPLNPKEKSGVIELDQVNFSVSLPYYKNGNIIEIFSGNTTLLFVDVSKFSQYCGNSVCEVDETNCPRDCPEENNPSYGYVGIISLAVIVVLLGIALLVYLRKRRA